MAKRKSTVITFPQLQAVVEKLKAKYPVALESIDSKRILCLKSDGNSKRVARLSSIKVPHASVTPFKFALTVFAMYDELDVARQVLHVLRELLRVEDFESSKLCAYPLQDFPEIVEKYGTLWEEKDDIENPLEEKKPGA